MNLPPHLSVRNNHLYIGGIDCMELAARWGTPLYVTDETRIVDRYRRYREALEKRYPKVMILYAAKANGNLAIMRTLAAQGAGADVFSSGELLLAKQAGMKPERLLFNGSSKSREDLDLAVRSGVPVSVDSLDELHQLDEIAGESGKTADIAFRVNPALEVPTHPKIATGLATSKFGIAHHLIPSAYQEALDCKNIEPAGIHCHIGSQILEVEPFARAADVMMRITMDLTSMGVKLKFIDIGGGLGIPYHHDSDPVPSPEDYAASVVPIIVEGIEKAGISPELWVEPGRSLLADSTVLLTKVNSIKAAHKKFANVDAGFNLLVRPAMYDSYHEVIVANKADEPPADIYTIAGPICETGDILASDRNLPHVASGDIIAVLDTGAYGFAMSSQYNGRPRCAEVLVNNGRAALMRRAETLGDLTAPMVVPPWQQ
ncbi:MAG TPA: diaminopimelate decarboxylase [Methanoregulaceae archaeon]|nr:diaminopimelate decarboxylase [Methanoregulaceae archaeon]